ncbi:MAG: hypothetical protein AAF447_15995 [Myxococcota bacterium]
MGVLAETDPVGPARADRGRAGAFATLAARASTEAGAAEALTLAWAAHAPLERLRLAEAFAADARARGADPTGLLELWARLEPEGETRRSLQRLLRPAFRLFRRERAGCVTLWLACPARRARYDVVLVIEARGDGRAVAARIRRRMPPAELAAEQERPLARHAAELAELLWRFVRAGGRLPPEARRFAPAFDVQASWPC